MGGAPEESAEGVGVGMEFGGEVGEGFRPATGGEMVGDGEFCGDGGSAGGRSLAPLIGSIMVAMASPEVLARWLRSWVAPRNSGNRAGIARGAVGEGGELLDLVLSCEW